MKKVLALLLAVLMIVGMFAACGKEKEPETFEVALVTDVGNIDDHSFNQGAWEGVVGYCEENGKTYAYYRPSEDSTAARIETIETAIEKGAKVVVCPGYLFEETLFEIQDKYPEVCFLLLDGEPHSADYTTYKTADNTTNILYQEEQAGFFAGYAAVADGYRKLGFLGGMALPAVIRYGYGFVQGAEAAAKDLGLEAGAVSINYWYCGGFAPTDDIKVKMDGWYSTDGVEVVFSCGGGIYLSAVAAASENNGKVIGVDSDQATESDLIIQSAMKDLTTSVKLALAAYYDNGGNWGSIAGKTQVLGAASGCVGLPTAEASWRLPNWSVESYNALFQAVLDGTVSISNATDAAPAVTLVTVDYQN